MVTILTALYSFLAYQRLGRETAESAKQWSESVSQLVSTANTSAYILSDFAAIESNLLQVSLLPGIDSIAVFRADGRLLSKTYHKNGQLYSQFGGKERSAVPQLTAQSNSAASRQTTTNHGRRLMQVPTKPWHGCGFSLAYNSVLKN